MRRGFRVRPQSTTRRMTDVFLGLDARMKVRDGAMNSTKNLTTERYPLLATRKKRGLVSALTAPGGLIEKDALAYVDNGKLFYNGAETALTGLSAGEKQLVSMGAYICIFPDKLYYNTENPLDYGSMEASYTSSAGSSVAFAPCHADGTLYEHVQVGATEPSSSSVDLWISTAGGTSVAMSWSASYGGWVELDTVYTRISFASQGAIPALFAEGDGVTIAGTEGTAEVCNGEKILYAVGGAEGIEADWVVVVGLLGASVTQTSSVTITRTVPTMDFVCEAQNRLWGCFYGNSGGQNINEIYCCALGDFKNWNQFRGLSTDSWAASVGSDGQWTGAVNYLGSPVFFKEGRIHQVGISAVGAHTIQETVCRGVQKGSHKSLIVVNETLYYKSRVDVCAWQGGFPVGVSDALGDGKYYDAAAGAFGGRYFLSMRDGGNVWSLFVYDADKGLWCREDALHVLQFAKVDDELYAIDADENKLLALNGTQGAPEVSLSWEAVTGVIGYEYPDRKYISRFDIRLRMDGNAGAAVFIEYDSNGVWIDSGIIARSGLGTVMLPIRPRRCDHLKIKIAGTGAAEILSIAKILELGSDV